MSRRVCYSLEIDGVEESFAFECDDPRYRQVVGNLMRDDVDLDRALETSVALLSANVRMHDDTLTQDAIEAQTIAAATVWFLFNEAADDEDRIDGDVLLVEKDGELFVADAKVESGA